MEEKITYKTRRLRAEPTEEHLWEVILLYQKVEFKTYPLLYGRISFALKRGTDRRLQCGDLEAF